MPWLANSRAESSGVVSSVLKRDFMWRVKAVRACRWILNKKEKKKNTSPFIERKGNSVDHFSSIFLTYRFLFSLFFIYFFFLSFLALFHLDQRVTVLEKFCFTDLLISLLGENEGSYGTRQESFEHACVRRAQVINCVMDMEWKIRFFLNEILWVYRMIFFFF